MLLGWLPRLALWLDSTGLSQAFFSLCPLGFLVASISDTQSRLCEAENKNKNKKRKPLAASVGRACNSQAWGYKFEPPSGCRD